MVLLSDMVRSSAWLSSRCVGSLLRLGLGTAVWYVTARIVFPHLEHVTGGRAVHCSHRGGMLLNVSFLVNIGEHKNLGKFFY